MRYLRWEDWFPKFDVTISYEPRGLNLWDFLCGRVKSIKIRVKRVEITDDLIGDYMGDEKFRKKFQKWITELWTEKDSQIRKLRGL